ncbi:MAG: lipase family alpha/beta hydrolase [Geminicoccaceae bacterium]
MPCTVIFAEGYLGGFVQALYWRQLLPFINGLRAFGYDVHTPRTPPTARIAERAEVLATCLVRARFERCVVVGHSMGGLDARYLAHALDPDRRIRMIVTLGTPHHGSALADYYLDNDGMLAGFARYIDHGALSELSLEAMRIFNASTPLRNDVRFRAIAASRPVAEQAMPIQPFGQLLEDLDGSNDGFVTPVSSAFGHEVAYVNADHMELVGWDLARISGPRREIYDPVPALRRALAPMFTLEAEAS